MYCWIYHKIQVSISFFCIKKKKWETPTKGFVSEIYSFDLFFNEFCFFLVLHVWNDLRGTFIDCTCSILKKSWNPFRDAYLFFCNCLEYNQGNTGFLFLFLSLWAGRIKKKTCNLIGFWSRRCFPTYPPQGEQNHPVNKLAVIANHLPFYTSVNN